MSVLAEDALVCQAVYLLQGLGECYRCKETTRMFALMALPPFSFEGEQDHVLDDDGPMLREVNELPESLVQALRPMSGSLWREDHSQTAGATYWMNHCEHCDAKQGDHFVQGPNGPFWPNDAVEMQAIEALRIDGPFRIPNANTAYSGAMADWRDHRHGVPPIVVPPRKTRKPRKKAAT